MFDLIAYHSVFVTFEEILIAFAPVLDYISFDVFVIDIQ